MTTASASMTPHGSAVPALARSADLELCKYHGLGNDFLVLVDPKGSVAPGADLARALCARSTGVGADGLLHTTLAAAGSGVALTFRLLNADGSEAEMSGNGIRCLVHAAIDAGLVPGHAWAQGAPGTVSVDTPAGRKDVEIRLLASPGLAWASVDMGAVLVSGSTDRCNIGHGQLLVDVGNPHLVVLGPDPANVDVARLGPALESSRPGGLNVEFVTLGPAPNELTMRVWERGVGETRACGTGSCAAAAALRHWGRVGSTVVVHQPGGSLEVTLHDDGTARLAGPSQRVARHIQVDQLEHGEVNGSS